MKNTQTQESFSPLGSPREEDQNIDWGDDLKFFIDNTDALLHRFVFPATRRHKERLDDDDAYKIYIRPVTRSISIYCGRFDIDDPENKFTPDVIEGVARKIADEQKAHIERGDYERKKALAAFESFDRDSGMSNTIIELVLKEDLKMSNTLSSAKPRNFVAKNAKMSGAGAHKNKKKAEKQGDLKHKKPVVESYFSFIKHNT